MRYNMIHLNTEVLFDKKIQILMFESSISGSEIWDLNAIQFWHFIDKRIVLVGEWESLCKIKHNFMIIDYNYRCYF
jgi:hypothetical protein